ncbi:MAG: TrkA family potassium uptake protein [Bacteroides sp.]|nr:TrkA family potassium uptake protein [Bacteroides sp.]MCM1456446.1 TrkA family potassium uptake protein [Lachnoclostridium sp.]
MRYLIIGLGIYGSNLARDLTDMGHEVIGADNKKSNVDAIKDYISTVYLLDATDEAELSLLPIKNVDLAIVAIGENFGASIRTVALLKKLNVKHIYARAVDTLHESILEGLDIDRILTPEQRAARDLTSEMGLGSKVQTLALDSDHYVLKFRAPEAFVGLKYADVDLNGSYHLTLVAVARPVKSKNLLGIDRREYRAIDAIDPDDKITADDLLVCYGTKKAYFSLFETTSPT